MHVNHEPAVILSRLVVAALLGALRGFKFTLLLSFSVGKAEEGEVILGMRIHPSCTNRSGDLRVHHLHGLLLPVQDSLHGAALWNAFRPHGHHNVDREPLPIIDFAHNLPGELHGDQMLRSRVLVLLPIEGASQEVLILDVDEVFGASDCVDVCVLDAPVNGVVFPTG